MDAGVLTKIKKRSIIKKKDFMNCAEKYDYVAEELLVCHIYTLGGQVIYNNLLLAGWRDFQEITTMMLPWKKFLVGKILFYCE